MTDTKVFEVQGTVVEPLPLKRFRVEIANQHGILASVSRKMRHWNRILPGDCVVVEMSQADPHRGVILRRC